MKMPPFPKTRSGKWAVGFAAAFVTLVFLSLIIALGANGNPALADNPFVIVLNVALNLAGLLSLVFGIFAVAKHREWVVWRYLAALYGLTLLLFLLGEFLFPH